MQNVDEKKQVVHWAFRKGPPPSLTLKWHLGDNKATVNQTISILTKLELVLCGGSADEPTKFVVSKVFLFILTKLTVDLNLQSNLQSILKSSFYQASAIRQIQRPHMMFNGKKVSKFQSH